MTEERKQNIQRWELLIQARLDSGMSVSKFCRANGYTENMYYHWVNVIHQEDPDFDTNSGFCISEEENTSSFVEISPEKIMAADTDIQKPVAEIQTGPLKIELYPNADAAFIRNLMEAVCHVQT